MNEISLLRRIRYRVQEAIIRIIGARRIDGWRFRLIDWIAPEGWGIHNKEYVENTLSGKIDLYMKRRSMTRRRWSRRKQRRAESKKYDAAILRDAPVTFRSVDLTYQMPSRWPWPTKPQLIATTGLYAPALDCRLYDPPETKKKESLR